jgi:hypothetical protein
VCCGVNETFMNYTTGDILSIWEIRVINCINVQLSVTAGMPGGRM